MRMRNNTWIVLLVAFRILIVGLGGMTALVISKAFEVEGARQNNVALPAGMLAGMWIDHIVNSRILPKVVGDVKGSKS